VLNVANYVTLFTRIVKNFKKIDALLLSIKQNSMSHYIMCGNLTGTHNFREGGKKKQVFERLHVISRLLTFMGHKVLR